MRKPIARCPLAALVGLVLLFVAPKLACADNWPNWRGTQGNGTAIGNSYPTSWSLEENIVWSVNLPGHGSSTPAVWQEKIFVTCQIGDQNGVVCLDGTGKQLWQSTVGGYRKGKHKKATGANPSPVTDGQHVYCYFKSGDLACFDLAGQQIWHHNLQTELAADNLWWDLGTSPVLAGPNVVIACMQTGDSYLVAYDKQTGNLAWKADRNLPAPVEANQSYTTPCLADVEGAQRLVILGADHFTSHSTDDGKEIWRVGDLNPGGSKIFRSISSPVIIDDLVVGCYARGGSLTAVRLGGQGDVTDSHVVWFREGDFADVPTPAVRDGRLYVVSDKGKVHCLDTTNGQTLWYKRLRRWRDTSASPIVAGDYLYVTNEEGTTAVMDLNNEGDVVATNELAAPTVATPVFVDGRILLRTANRLYCIADES